MFPLPNVMWIFHCPILILISQCESFIARCESRPPSLWEQHDYQSPSGSSGALYIRQEDKRQPSGKRHATGKGMEDMRQTLIMPPTSKLTRIGNFSCCCAPSKKKHLSYSISQTRSLGAQSWSPFRPPEFALRALWPSGHVTPHSVSVIFWQTLELIGLLLKFDKQENHGMGTGLK